jgi:hypothetical protein
VSVVAALVAGVVVVVTRTPVNVLTDSECDEQDAGHETDRPADLDTTGYRNRLVDLCEIEVLLRVEDHSHHRNTAHEVADAEDETRREPVHPPVRLIEGVRCGDWPAVTRFDAVNGTERDHPEEKTGYLAV